jgi:hypothetical protein
VSFPYLRKGENYFSKQALSLLSNLAPSRSTGCAISVVSIQSEKKLGRPHLLTEQK